VAEWRLQAESVVEFLGDADGDVVVCGGWWSNKVLIMRCAAEIREVMYCKKFVVRNYMNMNSKVSYASLECI